MIEQFKAIVWFKYISRRANISSRKGRGCRTGEWAIENEGNEVSASSFTKVNIAMIETRKWAIRQVIQLKF